LQFGTVTTGTVVNPTPAVCTNTTAAVATGLGGSAWETANLAVATDGILFSYQVPALPTATGATYVPQKRLRIDGISFSSYIQAALTGGPMCTKFQLAWGHTAVSLQTAEAATTKTARRLTLPQTQVVTATQAASTLVAQTLYDHKLVNPIYVNPGEFFQLVKSNTGTAATAGTIVTNVSLDYSWE